VELSENKLQGNRKSNINQLFNQPNGFAKGETGLDAPNGSTQTSQVLWM
jgi:hypothetical protein